jgi:hypothetical protein
MVVDNCNDSILNRNPFGVILILPIWGISEIQTRREISFGFVVWLKNTACSGFVVINFLSPAFNSRHMRV